MAAFNRVRLQLEQGFDLVCGHASMLTVDSALRKCTPDARMKIMQVLMYSAPWCRDCRAAKRYLDEHKSAYTEIDIEADPAASDEVLRHVGKRAIPQLVIDGEWFQPYKPGRGILYDELDMRFGVKTRL